MQQIPQKLLDAVERMPAFPKSVQQVLQMTADINVSPKDLVEVIKKDPIFTLKILKVVNSPLIGVVQEITSIHQASVYLGLNTLKNIALNLATIGVLPRTNKAGFDMEQFWMHSLAVASLSQKLSEIRNVGAHEADDFFSAGLLHDVGKVVFALYMPEEFKQALAACSEEGVTLHESEQSILGATHADIGARLAEKWSLPKNLAATIATHHQPFQDEPSTMLDCVFAANQVCKQLTFGFAGEHEVEIMPKAMQDRLGMDVDEITWTIPNLERELDKAKIFIHA